MTPTPMSSTARLERAVRRHDSAGGLTPRMKDRLDQRMASLLAQDRHPVLDSPAQVFDDVSMEGRLSTVSRAGRASGRGRTVGRVALVAASVAGVAIGASLVPTGDRAYAGWSATPTTLHGDQAEQAMDDCAGIIEDQFASTAPQEGSAERPSQWRAGLAEQRGRWTLTVLTSDAQVVATCMHNNNGGSSGSFLADRQPDRDSITLFEEGSTSVAVNPVAWFNTAMEGHFSVSGRSGSDVSGVVLHTTQGDVTATVNDGLWAAWWPLPDGEHSDETELSSTITLTDGRTVTLNREELNARRDAG